MKTPLYLSLLIHTIILFPTLSNAQETYFFGNDTTISVNPNNLIKTSDGNYIISGEANNYNPVIEGSPDFHYVVKFDLTGQVIWSNYYDLDWYARGKIFETDNDYQIFYTGDGSYVCNGWALNYPFRSIKTRQIDLGGNQIENKEEYNPECSNSLIHHEKYKGSNWFLTEHSDFGTNIGYLSLTEIKADGTKYIKNLDLEDDDRYGSLVDDSTIYIIGPKSIHHLSYEGNEIKSFAFDSVRYEKTIRAFFTPIKDSMIVCYTNSDAAVRKVIVRKIDKEGNFGKERIISGFRCKNAIQNQFGQLLIIGQNSDNDMSVIIMDDQLDSISTKTFPQNLSSYGTDIMSLDDGRYMMVGKLGGFEDRNQYIVIIDSLESTTGIQTNDAVSFSDIQLYPNPTTGKIKITSVQNISSLEILSLQGKTIKTKQGNALSEIDISDLIPGNYLLCITALNGQKLTKQVFKN